MLRNCLSMCENLFTRKKTTLSETVKHISKLHYMNFYLAHDWNRAETITITKFTMSLIDQSHAKDCQALEEEYTTLEVSVFYKITRGENVGPK